jgi:predicted alpha/beta superfamily hydrolase
MKLLGFLCFFITFPAWANGYFQLFKSESFPARDIYVYLPNDYDKKNISYPVLYMQDGQNLFDPSRAFSGQTWNGLATLNRLIEAKLISPLIVVAIDNTPERMNEYIPENKGDEYLDYIVEELKPLIDDSFRTKKTAANTGIMGSSLGGLISLYAGLRHSETFSLVGALSPSIWWNKRSIIKSYQRSSQLPLKVYLDSGTDGGEEPQDVLDLCNVLFQRGYNQSENLFGFIQDGAMHEERYWAMRFPIALKFLFPYKP